MKEHSAGHSNHTMPHDGHGDFMSMVMMTRDIPPSPDGLRMEGADLTLSGDHPALAAGMTIVLTLDGDTVRQVRLAEKMTTAANRCVRTASLQQDLEWLSRFAQVLGFRSLAVTVASMQRYYQEGSLDRMTAAARSSRRRASSNILLRLRLKGLAHYNGMDAYDRLRSGLARIAEPEKYAGKRSVPQTYEVQKITDSVTGLELSQALAAFGSYDIATMEGKL